METYENSFFRPKPRDRKCGIDADVPCRLNAFSCTERWWERNIKTFIQMIEDEYGKSVEIDTDELEFKGTVDIRIDDHYIITVRSKEEIATVLRTAYSMMTSYLVPVKPGNGCCDDDCCNDMTMSEL